MSRITDALRKARIANNLTQYDLAEILGVSQGFVSDVERGRRELPEKRYAILPRVLREAAIEAAISELEEQTQERIGKLRQLLERKIDA